MKAYPNFLNVIFEEAASVNCNAPKLQSTTPGTDTFFDF